MGRRALRYLPRPCVMPGSVGERPPRGTIAYAQWAMREGLARVFDMNRLRCDIIMSKQSSTAYFVFYGDDSYIECNIERLTATAKIVSHHTLAEWVGRKSCTCATL